MKVKIIDFIDKDHRSHYWYGGQCATIEHNGYTASIEAIGDVYAEYAPKGEYKFHVKDKNNAGWFYHEMHNDIKSDQELYHAIQNGDLVIDNNNWWECFIYDKDGKFHDLMWALDDDYIDDAIETVKEELDRMIKYLEEATK